MAFEDFMFPKLNVFVKVGWFKRIRIPKYSIFYGNKLSVVLQDVFLVLGAKVRKYSRTPSIRGLKKESKYKQFCM